MNNSSKVEMIGLKRHTVKLVPHDETWSIIFDETKKELLNLIGHLIIDIQHVGSTSIKKIKAKPIIDVAILVDNLDVIKQMIDILEKKDYEYRGDGGDDGGHLFVKCSEPDIRTHHIHIVQTNDIQWDNYLYFRDKLNSDRQLAVHYNNLKEQLENKYKDNREEYTKAKNDFINKILMNREKIL